MKHWAEYEIYEDGLRDEHEAILTELRKQMAENNRLRTAITEAMAAMKGTDRSNAECLNEAHSILSRVMGTCSRLANALRCGPR